MSLCEVVEQVKKKLEDLENNLDEATKILLDVVPFGRGNPAVVKAHLQFEEFRHRWRIAELVILKKMMDTCIHACMQKTE